MQAPENSEAKPQRKTKNRALKLVLLSIVILVVLVAFVVPGFVSSERGRKIILAKINSSIDGEVDFASLSMSWWKGVKVTDVSFNDGAGQTFVEVKQIVTKPHYGSILTGSLSFGETEIFEPRVEINLVRPEAQSSKRPQAERTTARKSRSIALPIKRIDMVVKDGNLKVTDRKAGTVEFSQINSRLNLRPPGQQTNFDVNLAVVDKDKRSGVHTAGKINPKRVKTGWSLKGTSGDLTVEVNDLELGSLGPIFALGGIEVQAEGRVSGNMEGEIKNGRLEKLSAEVKGRDLDVNAIGLTGDRFKTGRLDVNVKLTRAQQMINIESFDIEADWLKAGGRGTIPTTFGSLEEFLRTDSSLSGHFELDVAQVFNQMPGTFGLKKGIKVTSGMLRGDIETLTKNGKRKIDGQANLERLESVVAGKAIALSAPVRAEVEITSDKKGIKFDKLDLSSAFATINCSGTSELLNYRGDVNLAKLQAELGQFADIKRYEIAGELSGEGEVSIKKDKVTVDGSSAVKNLRLSSTEGVSAFEPMADAAFSVAVEQNKNILDIGFIKANASLGQVSIKDAVVPLGRDAKKEMSLDVSANNINLQKLQPFAVLLVSFPKEMQLSGIVESQVAVRSKQDSYHIATDATQIKNLKVNYLGKKPFEQSEVSVNFDAEVNPVEKTINVREFQLESAQIKIHKGEFSQTNKGDRTKLQGRVECEYDWAAVSTMAGPILPAGLVLEGKRKDAVSFASEYPRGQSDKLIGNLSTKAKVGFERGGYFGLNFGPTEVDIQIENGLLVIAPFSTTVNNGQLNFAGKADLARKPTLLKTPGPIQVLKDIQINEATTDKLLMYVNPIFANAVDVRGVANFNCERLAIPLAGAGKNDLEVVGTISITRLRLESCDLLGQILSVVGTGVRGQDITIHPTRFALQNGFLRYDDMQVDIGDNPVNFGGVIGLDKSLNMVVTLPYTAKGEAVRIGKKVEGARISLPLTGTINKPKLDLGRLLEGQLKQQLEERLKEELKGKLGEELLEGLEGLLKE
jgi:hypothetical protein